MPKRFHTYRVSVEWTGNRGTGTSAYTAYGREHTIEAAGKPAIRGSSDPAFRGDASCWNPEELLLASISACHKLWYLHLCAEAGIRVRSYRDNAEGTMTEESSGAGRFVRAVLRPVIVIAQGGNVAQAVSLHRSAHEFCFVANSLNFPVTCEPTVTAG